MSVKEKRAIAEKLNKEQGMLRKTKKISKLKNKINKN